MCYYSLQNLKQLHTLDISNNKFRHLPTVVYKLSELKVLDMVANGKLVRIEKKILHLTGLERLDCTLCSSLEHPPYAVCEQGLHAVVKYFTGER